MIYIVLFLLSIGIQLAAALYALRLIRVTGRKLAWMLISLAMVLMAWRRMVTFFSLLAAGKKMNFDVPELIALVISCLMLLGVLKIRDYFRSINTAEAERKLAEEKIHALNEALERKVEERTKQLLNAQEELVRTEKLSILGQLAGSVGHELRNPLGVMNNAVYFLKSIMPETDGTVREYLNIIKSEIDTSQRIISDLLGFARLKTPRTQSVLVQEIIKRSLQICEIPENINIQTDLPDTLPAIQVDPLQMGQVFQNLILNAVQAMPGGGSVRVSARRVQSSEFGVQSGKEVKFSELRTQDSARDGNFVEISVTDTGEGIAPENREKLFQPLFTTKGQGMGLGLVVTKKLTEANGGRITVESQWGKGTTFALTLPAPEEATWMKK